MIAADILQHYRLEACPDCSDTFIDAPEIDSKTHPQYEVEPKPVKLTAHIAAAT